MSSKKKLTKENNEKRSIFKLSLFEFLKCIIITVQNWIRTHEEQ